MRTTITYIAIAFTLVLMVVGALSCNTERKATRLIHRAERIDKPAVNKFFAENYHVTDSTDVRVVYTQGETVTNTVTTTDTINVNDTVYITTVKKETEIRVDTQRLSKFERQQNTAVIKAMQDIQDKLNQKLHKTESDLAHYKAETKRVKKNNTTIGIIVACYIAFKFLMLWLSTKFPASKIINVARKVF